MCDYKRPDDEMTAEELSEVTETVNAQPTPKVNLEDAIDAEYTEVEEEPAKDVDYEPAKTSTDDVPPEVMIELLDEVNKMIHGYDDVLQASTDMFTKLIDLGIEQGKAIKVCGILAKRCADRAQVMVHKRREAEEKGAETSTDDTKEEDTNG